MRILPTLALLSALASLATAQPTIKVSPTKLDCPGLVLDVAFSRDGRLLAAGFGAREQSGVRIWSASDRKLITTLRAGNETGSGIKQIEFSPDGKLLAGTNWNGDVLLWTIGPTAPRKLLTKRGSPESLSFSRDSAKLAFTSEESVVVYDLNLNQETILATATEHKDTLVGASFSPKTDSLFIFRRSSVEHWNTNDKKLLRNWKTFDSNFFGDVSPDGNYLIKVPNAYNDDFAYAWKFEIVNPTLVTNLKNSPVILSNWNFETDSTQSRIRVNQFQPVTTPLHSSRNLDHIVFGEIQNPGWNEGPVTRIYQDGTFLVTTNPGKCLAFGKLDQFDTDFESVHKRLLNRGLLAVDKEPLGALFNHFRVRFAGFGVKHVRVTRSDSEAFGSYSSSLKRQAFDRIYDQEESFISMLRNAGLDQVQK